MIVVQEYLQRMWVKMSSWIDPVISFSHEPIRLFMIKCGLVRPFGYERIKDIDNCDDSGRQRNHLCGETIWVPRTIPFLVMSQCYLTRH